MQVYHSTTGVISKASWMPNFRPKFETAVMNGCLYTIGGYFQNEDNMDVKRDMDKYDPLRREWTRRAPMPIARIAFAAIVVKNELYIIGGRTGQERTFTMYGRIRRYNDPPWNLTKIVYKYNPVQNEWVTLAPLP